MTIQDIASRDQPPGSPPKGKPVIDGKRSAGKQILIYVFVGGPVLAIIAALLPVAYVLGWGPTWYDVLMGFVLYWVGLLGVTVGFHRYFTHRSYEPKRWLKIVLALAGSLGVQGSVLDWTADHRRHHAFSDKEGDPHSPWLYGDTLAGVTKGFWHAHTGWLFDRDRTNHQRFIPDLTADADLVFIARWFGAWVTVSLALPAVIGGLVSWSWQGAAISFFWAGLVRVGLLHQLTWSINSICHMMGKQPFDSRDQSRNFWPLAIMSGGESWHNLHHADPTCARHGVLPGQIDISARVIWIFEQLGWVAKVKWPTAHRLEKLRSKSLSDSARTAA